jgi:hypothetical protein
MAEKTRDEQIADLKRIIKAREGQYGMAASVAILRKRLETLEASE